MAAEKDDFKLEGYPEHEKRDTESFSEDGAEPTPEEDLQLRHIGDRIPIGAWLVAVVELAERFTYYGLSGPFQNYMQNERGDPLRPGALGLGQKQATALSYFFQFWCYVTPLIGAAIADSWLGRYNTIILFSCVYILGIAILLGTSFPGPLADGHGFGGLVASFIVMGFGTGGIKANVSPLIAEQYTETKKRLRTLKSGERVVVDPSITIQSIYNIFYWCINIGSLSAIATVWLELKVDFWAAYLLPFCFFFIGLFTAVFGRKQYVIRPPKGSVLVDAAKIFWIAIRNGGSLDAALPENVAARGGQAPWGALFIPELRRALVACRVFCFFPIYWLVYGQMVNNFVSAAGTIETHGLPNDLLFNLNPITIIVFIPLMEGFVYPAFRRWGMPLRPITRITIGFIFACSAMVYAAVLQHFIYKAGPCYEFPLADECSDGGKIPNRVHVAAQVPAYALIGLSEIFASITGLEYAFTKAPPSMKSFVMAVFFLATAAGNALGIALSPTAEHPKQVIMYSSIAAATLVTGVIFYLLFRKYNATEEEMNKLDAEDEEFRPKTLAELKAQQEKTNV